MKSFNSLSLLLSLSYIFWIRKEKFETKKAIFFFNFTKISL